VGKPVEGAQSRGRYGHRDATMISLRTGTDCGRRICARSAEITSIWSAGSAISGVPVRRIDARQCVAADLADCQQNRAGDVGGYT
jgi:hypothetical protein